MSKSVFWLFRPLSARIFTVFGLGLIEGRELHKKSWIAVLLGTLLEVQDLKKVEFPERKNSFLTFKGLKGDFLERFEKCVVSPKIERESLKHSTDF